MRGSLATRAPLAQRGGNTPPLGVGQSPGIVLRTDMNALVAAELERARSAAEGELGEAVFRVFDAAQRNWWVDSGYSRTRLQMRTLADGGTGLGQRWTIGNDAWYINYVRSGGVHLVTDLLRDPLHVEVRKAAQAIADRLGKT